MLILSWNINGIRAIMKKGFATWLKKVKPDIICLQEIKIDAKAWAKEDFNWDNYQEFWNSAQRPGYAGTAILVRHGLRVDYHEDLKWDEEGRIQIMDIGRYYLINVYYPNAKPELARIDWKIKFNDKLLAHLKKLAKQKPLIVTGDFNVANEEIDLARPKENIENPGFSARERAWMTKFLGQGFKDTFRELHPNKIQYSWWSYRANARANNVGWRIDYFCVSDKIMPKVDKAFILDKTTGSDHAPVGIKLKK